MIIGRGMMARAMNDQGVIFASGVSDSSETRAEAFERERSLLLNHLTDGIVYFSTTSTKDTPYVRHKREMERIVSSKKHLILRLPQVVGRGGNSNNLINYLSRQILNGDVVNVFDTRRSVVDVNDVARIVNCLHGCNGLFSLNSIEPLRVEDIVRLIALRHNKSARIKKIKAVEPIMDNDPFMDQVLKELRIEKKGYTERTINKYI